MIKFFLTFYLVFVFSAVVAQTNVEYVGFIELSQTEIISYKINISEQNGMVKGYSVTDLGGEHETKSLLTGTYNEDEGILKFNENDIVYTKSPVVQEDFCFVNFIGHIKRISENKTLEGNFKGLYKNGNKCIDGKIRMMGMSNIMKKAEKLNKKIQRSKKVEDDIKEKIDVVKTIDTLNMGILNKNENLTVFSNQRKVKLVIFDGGKVDGDIINLSINGKLVVEDYTLTANKKEFTINIDKQDTEVEIFALNVGASKPNTVTVEISDIENYVRTSTNLEAGESTKISIAKKQ